jgi:hypothetical protein
MSCCQGRARLHPLFYFRNRNVQLCKFHCLTEICF